MVGTKRGRNHDPRGLLLMLFTALIMLPCLFYGSIASDPVITDNGDYTYTATWDFDDMTNYTLSNVTASDGEINLLSMEHFWNQSNASDFSLGQRSNVVGGDGIVISTDDLILGHLQNQNFTSPYGWNYTNGTQSMVNAQWSSSEKGVLFSSHAKNTTAINMIMQPDSIDGIDTYLDANAPSVNQDGKIMLQVKRGSPEQRSLLWFDVSSFQDTNILNARLELYCYAEQSPFLSLGISVHRVLSPWVEGSATWDKYNGINDWPIYNDGGDFDPAVLDSLVVGGNSFGWKSWNITSLVKSWVSGAVANYGVLLYGSSLDNTYKSFFSSDYSQASYRPRLNVDYYELNSFNETANITQDFPVLDPGAYRDSDDDEFKSGTLENVSIIPVGGGAIILGSDGYYKFDPLDDVSNWAWDPSTMNKGSFSLSNTIYYEGTGSMKVSYNLPNNKQSYGVHRTTAGSWDWSGYTDLLIWAKSKALGEVMKVIIRDVNGVLWEYSTSLIEPWTSYTFDLTEFGGDISRINALKLHFTDTTNPTDTYIDNITLLGGSPYFFNGNYTSRVVDGGYATSWDSITWNENKPAGTSIEIRTRTGNTSSPDGSWSSWSSPYANPSDSHITSPLGRYIQYKAYLRTQNSAFTPRLDEVTLIKYEYNLTFTYSVEAFNNVTWSRIFLRLNDIIIWEKYPSGTLSSKVITFDMGRFLYNVGDNPLEFGLTVKGNTTRDMNITVFLDNFQIKGPLGFYLSQVHDTGSEAIWGNVTWNAYIPQNTSIVIRTRSSVDNVLWSPWSAPLSSTTETIKNPMGRYIQYEVNFSTAVIGVTPVLKDINFTYKKYASVGKLTFNNDLVAENVTSWGMLVSNSTLRGQSIKYDYSIDSGQSWNPIADDLNLSSVSTFLGKIRFRVIFTTLNTSLSPTLYSVKLVYSVNQPPVIVGVIPSQTRIEDGGPWSLSLTPYESDFEDSNNKLRWYIQGENTSLYVVSGEYSADDVLTFTPRPDAFGNDLVTLCLEDSFGATDSQLLWINITPINDPPEILGVIPSFDKTENDPNWQLDLSGYKYDKDNAPSELSWSVVGASSALFDDVSISKNIMTFDLAQDAYGNDEIEIRLSDPEYVVSQKIWVNVSFINKAPVINGEIPDIAIQEDAPDYILDLTSFETDREDPYPSPSLSWTVWGINTTLLSYSVNDNNITFSLHHDMFGSNELTLLLTDSLGLSTFQKIWVNVTAQNDAPRIMGVIPSFEKSEDSVNWNYDLFIYKSDIDNKSAELSFSVFGWDPNLFDSVVVIGDILFFDLKDNAFGNDDIIIQLSDGLLTDSQVIWVNITPVNDPPTITGSLQDYIKIEDALPWTLNLTQNESDVEDGWPSPALTWSVSGVNNNLLSVVILDNNITFTLNPDAYGNNEITLTLTDSGGLFDSMSFWVNVSSVNDAPRINGIIPSFEKMEDANPWSLNLSQYKFDIDNPIYELTWIVSGVDYSIFNSVVMVGDVIFFDLKQDAHGSNAITLELTDSALSDFQVIYINVTSVNDPPVIFGTISDYLKTEDDTPWILDLTALEIDIEEGGPSPNLTWEVTEVDFNLLSVSILDNNITFTLKPDAFGVNRLKLTLRDSEGLWDFTYFWVNATAVNDAPRITGSIPDFSKKEDDANWIYDLSTNMLDVDNLPWELSWEVSGWDGTLFDGVDVIGNELIFDLRENAAGCNEITLNLTDGQLKDSRKFWVNVTSVNDAPVITKIIGNMQFLEDASPFVLDLTEYEFDVEDSGPSPSLSWNILGVNWGMMTVTIWDNNLTFYFVPNSFGSNLITVMLTDSQGLTASQKLFVNLTPQNDAPKILGKIPNFSYKEDAQDWSLDLSPYKMDVDNTSNELSWSVFGWNTGLFNSVDILSDIVTFNLKQNAYGNNLITFVLSDGLLTDSQLIWVNITSENDFPVILGQIPDIKVNEDSQNWTLDLTLNESDVEDGAPSASLVWSVSGADDSIVSIFISDNNLTFSLKPHVYGLFFFTLKLTDSNGGWDSQLVKFEVVSVNDNPYISPDIKNIVLNEDNSYYLSLSPYAKDIEDLPNQLRWSISKTNSSLFSWYIDPLTMMLEIEPLPNAYGSCLVDFTLTDSQGAFATQKDVQILIISQNDAPYIWPVIPNSLFETLEDKAISVILTGYENDVEDSNDLLVWDVENVDTTKIRYSLDMENDNLIIIPIVEFLPEDKESITTQITLVLSDSQGLLAKQNVSVKIIPVNNAPVFEELPDLMIKFNKPFEFDLLPYIFDEDTEADLLSIITSEPATDTGQGYIKVEGLKLTLLYPESRNGQNIAVLITLSDGHLSDYAIMQVKISDHTPPELIKPIDNYELDEDTWLVNAFDLDNHFKGYNDGSLNYSYYMAYSHHGEEYIFVSIQTNNTVDFFSAQDWYGMELITFRARDSWGAIAETTIMVTIKPVNDAPVILDIPDQECKVGVPKTIDITPYISDIDTPLESLMVTTNSIDNIKIHGHKLILDYANETHEFVDIFVFDGELQSMITIEVISRNNQAPVISPIPKLVVRGGEIYLFSLIPYVNDPDDDKKELLIWTDSDYITQNNGDNLLLQIDYPVNMIGLEETVNIYVSDGHSSNSSTVKIQITDDLVPKLKDSIPNKQFNEDTQLLNTINLYDYFINATGFEVFGNDKVNVTIEDGWVSLSALANWSGTEIITFRGILNDAIVEDTIDVIVRAVDDPPVLSPLPSFDKKVNDFWTLNLNDYIYDVDNPVTDMTITVDSPHVVLIYNHIYFRYTFPIQDKITVYIFQGLNEVHGVIHVNITVDNFIPTYNGLITTTHLHPTQTWSIDLDDYFYDMDNELFFSCNKQEITINPITHVAFWTPNATDSTLEDVIFYANDGAVTIESSPIDIVVDKENATLALEDQFWWIILLLAIIIVLLMIYVFARGEDEEKEVDYEVPVPKAVEYLSTHGGGNYIIKAHSPEKTYLLFSGLLQHGFEGLCITTKQPEELTSNYDLGKAWIIKLTLRGQKEGEESVEETRMMGLLALGDEDREDDKYIFSLNFNRIVETIEEFLTTGENKVVLLDGLEYILGGEELIMYIGFIASLRERLKDRKSCLLIPIDPKTLSEKELGLLERETIELGKVLSDYEKESSPSHSSFFSSQTTDHTENMGGEKQKPEDTKSHDAKDTEIEEDGQEDENKVKGRKKESSKGNGGAKKLPPPPTKVKTKKGK